MRPAHSPGIQRTPLPLEPRATHGGSLGCTPSKFGLARGRMGPAIQLSLHLGKAPETRFFVFAPMVVAQVDEFLLMYWVWPPPSRCQVHRVYDESICSTSASTVVSFLSNRRTSRPPVRNLRSHIFHGCGCVFVTCGSPCGKALLSVCFSLAIRTRPSPRASCASAVQHPLALCKVSRLRGEQLWNIDTRRWEDRVSRLALVSKRIYWKRPWSGNMKNF